MLMISHWLYLAVICAGLGVSLRHIRLSSFSPGPAAGFGLLLAANLVTQVFQLFYMRSGIPMTPVPYPQAWQTMVTISSFMSIAGWTLLVSGLYFVFNDVSQRLALLQLAPQDTWKNLTTSDQAYNRQAYHPQSQVPNQAANQEENHASAFVPHAAPTAVQSGPAFAVHPEPSENTVTLGSAHQ